MAALQDHEPRHHVSQVVAGLQAQLDALAGASLWSMSPGETADTLTALTRLVASVSELELRVADHARRTDVGESTGATSTASWWAHATGQTRPEAHRRMRLAAGLDRYALVREALAAGGLVVEQAIVIVKALDDLPAEVEVTVRGEAERRLVALGRDHDAKDLKRLGLRILEVLDPEAADEHERRKLAEEERNANATVRFTMAEDGHGRVYGRFTLPALHGAMLKKALLAIAAPKHVAATEGQVGERRPGPERLGRAFCEYLERYPADRLPAAGGVNATVVVTMTLDSLVGGLAAASLDTGERITADRARRLACEAGIIPAVLGGQSQVLDLGRKRRFHNQAQRIALALEQGGCTAEGCDWPPGMCHAHHDQTPWGRGGGTSLRNGRLLCPKHHARAHDPTFTMTNLPGGKVAFTKRT